MALNFNIHMKASGVSYFVPGILGPVLNCLIPGYLLVLLFCAGVHRLHSSVFTMAVAYASGAASRCCRSPIDACAWFDSWAAFRRYAWRSLRSFCVRHVMKSHLQKSRFQAQPLVDPFASWVLFRHIIPVNEGLTITCIV